MIENIYEAYKQSSGVTTDTRNIEKDSIFFALKGANFNGNNFAKQALNQGAKYVVIDELTTELPPNTYFLVKDVLQTLQALAAHHRRQLTIPFIGITGSNGKTTTKEIIKHILQTTYETYATKGNYNNHIGVPLTLLAIPENAEIAIIEMGANHVGEIAQLCEIAQPDYGIITNIGKAHLEGFGSYDGVIQAKSELYKYIKSKNGKIFVNADDDLLMDLSKDISRITYGTNRADIKGELLQDIPFIKMQWQRHGKTFTTQSSLFGKYNFYNLLAGISIASYFNVSPNLIKEAVETFKSQNNRSEIRNTSKDNTLILDAYNANPSSMQQSIAAFAQFSSSNKICILGDMFELGEYAENAHLEILEQVKNAGCQQVFLSGNEFYKHKDKFPSFLFFKTTDDLLKHLKEQTISGKTILIKGSRSMQLEKTADYL
jgi:UDP-N-acetylmuramoyl-tripeptide--D-alanyl-D-alanine ligase